MKNAAIVQLTLMARPSRYYNIGKTAKGNKARGEKAKYIVNAVQHYENCVISAHNNKTLTNEKHIEAVVNRVLLERETGLP